MTPSLEPDIAMWLAMGEGRSFAGLTHVEYHEQMQFNPTSDHCSVDWREIADGFVLVKDLRLTKWEILRTQKGRVHCADEIAVT